MDPKDEQTPSTSSGFSATKLTRSFGTASNLNKLLIGVLVVSLVLGAATGYILATKSTNGTSGNKVGGLTAPKTAQQDTRTFRDFAEGVVKPTPKPTKAGEYSEGTHLLEREGATPVALTSSVVDLSQYEGKKVKVFGETQKALKAGWLMDVGKVEEIQ